ncbi:glycosyltransferase [Oceanisphaera sediminis]|uniref:Glycosyltransferase n=1 Tax=Oceanisphaera sediminis TaxID=981381 RepID=A0ABP7DNC1_9GAMM
MKKILHLTHTDVRSDSRILKEMESAYSNGYSVHGVGIRLNEGTKNINCDNYNIVILNINSKKLIFLPAFLRHFFTLIEFFIKSIFHSLKIKPDLIHCNDTLVFPVGVFVKIFTKAKLVYDAHELESDRNGLSKLLGKATLFVEKALWRFVDGLIVVSPSIKQWYLSNIGYKESSVVLNSPIFKEINSQNKDYLRDKFLIPKDNNVFIYVGILGAGRGIDVVLEAFKEKPEAHLVFLGYGEYYDELKSLEATYSNVHVHDAVEHSKVVEVVSSADVGLCLIENVSLSDYYCLPNKLFEYAFAGLPVLASNFPDISKVVSDYSLGFCTDLDEKSIRNGIEKFETGQYVYAVDNCKLADLSWAKQESNLISLYKKVLK